MAKKNNPKAEKAQRNKEYALKYRKRAVSRFRSPRPAAHQTACSACGAATTVPFKPVEGKPVLCRTCFQQAAKS